MANLKFSSVILTNKHRETPPIFNHRGSGFLTLLDWARLELVAFFSVFACLSGCDASWSRPRRRVVRRREGRERGALPSTLE